MTRNLSLALEDTAESAAKAGAAEQKSLDSLAKFIIGNRIAFDYLLAEQRDVCAVANITCCSWINTSGEIEAQYGRSLSKPLA